MQYVSYDFEKKISGLKAKSRRTILFMASMAGAAVASYGVFALVYFGGFGIPLAEAGIMSAVIGERAINALSAANGAAELAGLSALRVWSLRESKMTLLLTHAMILEDEPETAMQILLNSDLKT